MAIARPRAARRLRILHVVRQFHPCVGGMERFSLDLGRRLVERGHRVGVVTLDRVFGSGERLPGRGVVDGIAIRRVPWWGWRGYPLAPAVLRGLRVWDVVHVHGVDFFADYLALTKPLHRRPLVLSTHGGFFHTETLLPVKRVFFDVVTRRTLRAYAAVVPSGADDEARFRPVAPERVRPFENAVDPSRFGPVERRPEPGRLLTVGRLAANKRVDRLIRALAAGVAAGGADLRLDVVGDDWGGLRAELAGLAADWGVADRITFHGGLADAEVGELLGRAQWFVQASEYEGFGLAPVEAMGCGVPALLSDIPAFRRLVAPGENGYLLDFGQPDTAGRDLARLAVLPAADLARLGERARRSAARYAWPETVTRFEAIYRSAAAGTRERANQPDA